MERLPGLAEQQHAELRAHMLFNVIGFQSLNGVGQRGVTSPVGADTAWFTATRVQLTDQVMQRLEATAVWLKR